MQNSKVHLDYNCKEPFWKFTQKDGEDYCKTCQTTIIDFTGLNKEEIIAILKQQPGKSCGKFYSDQIVIDEKTKQGPSGLKIFFASVLTSILTLTSSAQTDYSETIRTEQSPINNSDSLQPQIENLPEVECYQVPENIDSPVVKKKRRIYIGKYYLSSRFPFIHQPRKGRYRFVGTPSF